MAPHLSPPEPEHEVATCHARPLDTNFAFHQYFAALVTNVCKVTDRAALSIAGAGNWAPCERAQATTAAAVAVIVKGNQAVLIRFRSVPKLAAPMELSSEQEMVFRHVINGQRIVARQRERVEMLARNGHDTTEAERTLDIFARTLDIFEGDLRRILADELKRATVRRG